MTYTKPPKDRQSESNPPSVPIRWRSRHPFPKTLSQSLFMYLLMVLSTIARIIASGFGSGYIPKSPGTMGSLAAVIAWIVMAPVDLVHSILCIVALGFIGYLASTYAISLSRGGTDHQITDPQWIVIDEWCGMWIALVCCPEQNFKWIGLAFCLFRLFDISKIGPVRWAERAPGALGVMLDDVVAGGCAGACLFGIHLLRV